MDLSEEGGPHGERVEGGRGPLPHLPQHVPAAERRVALDADHLAVGVNHLRGDRLGEPHPHGAEGGGVDALALRRVASKA